MRWILYPGLERKRKGRERWGREVEEKGKEKGGERREGERVNASLSLENALQGASA